VAVGTQNAAQAWFEMLRDMPQGEPKSGDEGLDNTHTWGRTYWGGAMFCLLADVAIRKNTKNGKGLRDALQGIVAQGGNIEVQWSIERALEAGDKAVGGNALMTLYQQMAARAVTVDLTALWKELGVERQEDTVGFDDEAPLAAVRKAILS
jgi:predicted metalloprotease with PDZ domain